MNRKACLKKTMRQRLEKNCNCRGRTRD